MFPIPSKLKRRFVNNLIIIYKLLTTVLSTVKDGFQTYCDTAYSRNGINQMWILKNSKDLVESLSSQSLSVITFIKTFDFSTLYTT